MPNSKQVYVRKALANFAVRYPRSRFVAEQLIPNISVDKQSGEYPIFDAARRAMASVNDLRTPGVGANMVKFDITWDNYLCGGHALKTEITREERKNADEAVAAGMEAASINLLTGRVLTNQDIDLRARMDAAVAASGLTANVTDEWNDRTSGIPADDIETAINAVRASSGLVPNVMLMDFAPWQALASHPQILDRIVAGGNNTEPAMASPEAIAKIFKLDKVIVVDTMKNTAMEGQTASLSTIWGDEVYVLHQQEQLIEDLPSFMFRFVWDAPTSVDGWEVTTWTDDDTKSDYYRIERYSVQKVIAQNLIYKIGETLT